MTNRNFFYIFIFLTILLSNSLIFCSKVITGNSKNLDQTFSFNIGPYVFSTKDESYNDFQLYIGAGQELNGNNYSISKVTRSRYNPKDGFKFIPLCPEKVKINNMDLCKNPLIGAKILHLGLLGEYPVVVKNNDKRIYVLSSFLGSDKESVALFYSAELNDSNGKLASEIVKLETAENIIIYGSHIIAAVKGSNAEKFGTIGSGSGIALIYINDEEKKIRKKNEKTKRQEENIVKYAGLRVLDANSSKKQKNETKYIEVIKDKKKEKEKKQIPLGENKAALFDGSLKAIKINNDAQITSDIVDMHWDKRLRRLYIACSVKSNSNSNSGARAIVVARIVDHQLHFQPIVPDKAIQGNNQIIATGLPNCDVSIQKVLTMHTSTLLSYLIVVGGNGSEYQVGNKVYALPIVNKEKEVGANIRTNVEHGVLAKYDQDPKYYFEKGLLKDKGRQFVKPAENPNDLLTSNDQAGIVGFGDLPLNQNEKISDIFIANDSVFVCISNDYNGINEPGIFYSQAIFDSKGRICSWTKWARAAGTDKKIKCAALDVARGHFWYINNNENIDTVETTYWGQNNKNGLLGGTKTNAALGLVTLFDNYFHLSHGGVHGIFDFSKNTSGFNNFSMLIATGLKKIGLIETGSLQNGFYKPTKGDFATGAVSSINGQMPSAISYTKFALISGGVLNGLGSITSAEIASNELTDEHWIFVAGVDGLAVLIDENGKTWKGKISSLNQIPITCRFKKIGNYSFVNKLQSDGEFLYILTNNKLDRIKLSAQSFTTGNIDTVTLAESKNLRNCTFNDFGVSNKFALLATSIGLFRVGNSRDIRFAKDSNQVNWTKVNIPESLQIISKLFFISTTGKETGFAYKGQVYVLNSYRGFNQARLNRFIVNLTDEINDKTIEPLPDLFVQDKLSNFYDFGIFKENFWTNGALLFSSCSKDVEIDLYLHILAPRISTGVRSFVVTNLPVDLDIKDKNTYKIFQIGKLIRNSASGSLLINGNFGLRTNE